MNSNFEVITSEINGFTEITLINRNSEECISVIPGSGCRLNNVSLRKNNIHYSIVRQLTSPELSDRNDLFNNVKLFPFANRIGSGTYTFNNNTYHLPLNYPEENNAAHGIVYNRPFEFLGNRLDKSGSLLFRYDYPGDFEGYPFRFSIFISYTLTEAAGVICTTRVLNKSDNTLLFNDGWHPYFTLGRKIDEFQLSLNAERIIKTNSNGIPDGTFEDACNAYDLIELRDKEFDTVMLMKNQRTCTTELYSPADDITLSLWQDSGEVSYRYLVIYTPPDRKSIAIEPMTSNADSFNNKEHLITLAPGKYWECSFGFKLK